METGDLYLGTCFLPPLFLVLCGIPAWLVYWQNRAAKVKQLGQTTSARVVTYSGRRYDLIVTVEYMISESEPVTAKIRYLGGPQNVYKGAQISIRYNPNDPTEAVVATEDPGIEGMYIFFLSVCICMILGYWFWLFLVR